MKHCRITDLNAKDVICMRDGQRIGCVSDVEVNTCDGRLVAIVVWGKPRLFGLLGRGDDCVIPWEDIHLIGEDAILVESERPRYKERKGNGFFGLFR